MYRYLGVLGADGVNDNVTKVKIQWKGEKGLEIKIKLSEHDFDAWTVNQRWTAKLNLDRKARIFLKEQEKMQKYQELLNSQPRIMQF